MKLLLDAHTFFWSSYKPQKLSKRVADVLTDPANTLYVSESALWELAAKGDRVAREVAEFDIDLMKQDVLDLGASLLPITLEVILTSAKLPKHHLDPFDRYLIAQAMIADMVLVSKDSKAPLYDVAVLW